MFICCTGSIFDMTDIHTWVNPVNCVGVSGKGLTYERVQAILIDTLFNRA